MLAQEPLLKELWKKGALYGIPLASGLAATSSLGALTLPSDGTVLDGAHQVLAYTGFAFGAYVAVALVLIFAGLVLRKASTISVSRRSR
jgi:hypothetical protein